MNIARIAIAPALALTVVAAGISGAAADKKNDGGWVDCAYGVAPGPAVVITGGEVYNETNINLGANGGSAIADASGGGNNIGVTSGGGLGVNTGAAGNGGGANAVANGGAISTGDINSGGNAGNAITVGNTSNCAPAPAPAKEEWAPMPEAAPVYEAPAAVVALPATGAGVVDAGMISAIAAAGAAAAAGLGLRRRG